MAAVIAQEFISVGCNPTTTAAAWSRGRHAWAATTAGATVAAAAAAAATGGGESTHSDSKAGLETGATDGLLVYGAHHLVVLYNPTECRIISALRAHTGRVNSVDWLTPLRAAASGAIEDEAEFVSGASDNLIHVWKRLDAPVDGAGWAVASTLTGHKGAVTCVKTWCHPSSNAAVLVSCSTDCTIRLWVRRSGQDWQGTHVVQVAPAKTVECVNIGQLPGSTVQFETAGSTGLFVATGGVDKKLHLYRIDADADLVLKLVHVMEMTGHEDWIRTVDITRGPLMDDDRPDSVLVATGSSDHRVRVWRIAVQKAGTTVETADDDDESAIFLQALNRPKSFHTATAGGGETVHLVSLETLLYAHEGWVSSVRWAAPHVSADGAIIAQPVRLCTSSMDRTLAIWEVEKDTGLWNPVYRMGELGGNSLGFVGAGVSPSATRVLAHGHRGALHIWEASRAGSADSRTTWSSLPVVLGHIGPVTDVAWGTGSAYVVSVSSDQTARVFGRWVQPNPYATGRWLEIARPQIHGYDLTCACVPATTGAPHRLVSGGDEKTLRVFDAPILFLDTLGMVENWGPKATSDAVDRMQKAFVPELGLSNKGISASGEGGPIQDSRYLEMQELGMEDEEGGDGAEEHKAAPTADMPPFVMDRIPPVEEDLLDHTLWPEVQKLFGHHNGLVCCAASPDGQFVATACKARTPADAVVRLWNTATWREAQVLPAHSLTVIQMAFSPNSQYLLTVSKDRQLTVFKRNNSNVFQQFAAVPEAHRRIIWSCGWSHDGKYFVTGARDSLVSFWALREGEGTVVKVGELPAFAAAVTAVAFAPQSYTVAVGTEDGLIHVTHATEATDGSALTCAPVARFPLHACHAASVTRLAWRAPNTANATIVQLASSSEDHSVRIVSVAMTPQK